jgi:hypothetical protein
MVMSGNQNAAQNGNIKPDNSSLEKVEPFKYLGTALMDQNSIQEEIHTRLTAGNACYCLVQNILSSSLLTNNIRIKTHRTVILPVVCMGIKLGRSH